MRKAFVISLLAVIALAGCQVNEIVEETSESKSFSASVEDSFNGGNTRTSLDDNGNVLFKMGDQISIFAGSTVNEHYQVTDASDGKTSAVFNKVTGSGFVGGGEIDNNVAFYPYAASAEISKNGSSYVISEISLPATQNYAEGSFGNGAFPMAAVTSTTDDMHLKFKNVLGGLKIQLKGTATITSITVTGNTNEILCGDAEVTVSNTSTPSINMTDATARSVTLDCGEGVALDPETSTPFIIALPPMTMEGGFTVVVTDTEDKQMEIKTTKSQTINRSMLLKMPAVRYEGSPMSSPLTFTSTGETSISLVKVGSPDDVSLEYRVNGGGWTTYTVGDNITLADGEEVSFRAGASGNTSFGKTYDDYHKFTVLGSGTVAASGSIMSLINQEDSLVIPSPHCFSKLFGDCTGLTKAPELPATTLAENCYSGMFVNCIGLTSAPDLPATSLYDGCYSGMFGGCTGLTKAPELPATTLADNCYNGMFNGCTGLTTALELPATTLAAWCYDSMFKGCTSLTTAPELPATTLAEYCYNNIFRDCTNLAKAPELPATTLAKACYAGMFYGCTSLTSAPELPATALAEFCYSDMFRGCTNLITVPVLPAATLVKSCYGWMFSGCTNLTSTPELPATTLAENCYRFMFSGCTSLATAPGLPATTLAEGCYWSMFSGCTSLTTAPELPATTLAEKCYRTMFSNCTKINYIKALFTTTPDDTYTKDWVSGVASVGTFVKSKDATWDVTGVNGVPVGWIIYSSTGLPSNAEAVDLGLSVNWANMNVGATRPEGYVNYFSWGEVQPKQVYWWDTYKWGSRADFTKYNPKASYGIVDDKTLLLMEDDAAHLNWGGDWRMPTYEEWTELRTFCSWTWTTDYEGTGVAGMIVTSNKAGFTGRSIFLPATGRMQKSSLIYEGVDGNYWSSSLHISEPIYALGVGFDSDNNLKYELGRRCLGLSVRPVVPNDSFVMTGVGLDKTEITLLEGYDIYLHATNKKVTWRSDDPSVATVDSRGRVVALKQGHTTITVATLTGGFTAYCNVTVKQLAVDLGLSVKWASDNLRSSTPPQYGKNYRYAWGELNNKDSYVWETYKWCSGSASNLTKYNTEESFGTVDDNTVLDLEDDAAHVILGGTWRIPTIEEWDELRDNCTWTWISDNGGTSGVVVTSKVKGYTDKSIFLQNTGGYWSSSLYLVNPNSAWCFVLSSSSGGGKSSAERSLPRSIRPVCE